MLVKQRLEIRGKEKKISQKENEYIIVRVENIETGEPYELYDPNGDNFDYYKRGREADFVLKLSQYRGDWQIAVESFKLVD